MNTGRQVLIVYDNYTHWGKLVEFSFVMMIVYNYLYYHLHVYFNTQERMEGETGHAKIYNQHLPTHT